MASRITIRRLRDHFVVDAPADLPRRGKRVATRGAAYRLAKDIADAEVRRGFFDVEVHDEEGNVFEPREFSGLVPKAAHKRQLKYMNAPMGRAGGRAGRTEGHARSSAPTTQLSRSAPTAHRTSGGGGLFGIVYEVRSGASAKKQGILEGVFKKGSTARSYANALEGVGAKGVVVLPVDAKKATERHAFELAAKVRQRFTHRAGYSRGRTNREGMTWIEWKNAAGLKDEQVRDRHFLAFTVGEDPTEYRAGAKKVQYVHHAGRARGKINAR